MKKVVVGIVKRKINNQEKYLLVSSKMDFKEYTGFYYPPGGHVKKNENKITGLKRELEEEVGLDIIYAKKIASTKGDIPNQATYWYLCEVKSYAIKINHTELKDANYFSKEEMLNMKVWPATLKFFNKYIF